MITNLTPKQLRQAADLQEKILALQHELAQLVGAETQTLAAPISKKGRRLSAQGLANIRAGARKRWAGKGAANGTSKTSTKPKRKISAAGRARISELLKARWAAAKKAGRSAL